MPDNRPAGREQHVTQGGKGVRRRGEGTGLGSVGGSEGIGGMNASSGARRESLSDGRRRAGGGSGTRGSGGKSPLTLIIILAVLLLGGGGGLGALFGGGGSESGSSGSSSYSSGGSTGTGSYSSSTGTGSYGSTGSGSSSGGGYSFNFGGGSGSDGYITSGYGQESSSGLPDLSSFFGSDTYVDEEYALPQAGGYGSSGSYGTYGSSGSYGSSYGSSGSYGSYGTSSGSGSYSTSESSGTGYGSLLDLFDLESLLGGGLSQSAGGISSGWTDGSSNVGVLNTSVSSKARAKYTKLKGNGKDVVTIMVYMCGTDLESRAGMATSDLTEMAGAELADNVNLIVYTGGCTGWKNNIVDSRTNQIYRVHAGGLERLVDDDGNRTMTDPATLTRFITWCAKHYPANRNELIFWDHGGGSVSGFGYDQKHQTAGSMGLAQIRQAIGNAGVRFDFIGFDACLMATAENALALTDYADYLIASEETEPGMGWYYTNWLTSLSQDTSTPTTQLGKMIIDDFVDVSAKQCRGQSTTLSLVDLAELQKTLPKALSAFSTDMSELMENSEYKQVASARSQAREFAISNRIDQVDLVNLAQHVGSEEGQNLTDVLLSAVKYNRTSADMTNSYGLSIYFPKAKLSQVSSMVNTYKAIGMDEDYTRCIQQYATVQASGQAVTGGSSSAYDIAGSGSGYPSFGSLFGGSSGSSSDGSDLLFSMLGSLLGGDPSGISGLTSSNMGFLPGSGLSGKQIAGNLQKAMLDPENLSWKDNGTVHTISMSQDDWDLVSGLDLNMLFDDGEGYVDLGMDNVFSFTSEGALIGETNRTWLSIDGQPVAYYHISSTPVDGGYTTIGRVPVLLNGEYANLILVFDPANPRGYIAGARTDYRSGETDTLAKAMTALSEGDTIDFLCDYYRYDGTLDDSYYLGEQMIYHGQPEISNTDVGDGGALVRYRFTDLCGQQYWTQAIAQ